MLKRVRRNGEGAEGQQERGFTVLQLVVTITILCIVSTFAVIGISSARAATRLSNSSRTMAAYLESDTLRDSPPEIVIWEIPERYLPVAYELRLTIDDDVDTPGWRAGASRSRRDRQPQILHGRTRSPEPRQHAREAAFRRRTGTTGC